MIALHPARQKLSLDEIMAQILEQEMTLEEHLAMLRTEPQVLNTELTSMFYIRPELVPDEKGRILPALTDEYLSSALFDVVVNSVRGIAVWDYTLRIVQMLSAEEDKLRRAVLLDELSNVCTLEYRRAQSALKRQLCNPFSVAVKRFRRITSGPDQSAPKITMKGRPSDWTVADPLLHYVLQLCHPDTSTKQAVDWVQKLDDHNARHTQDRDRLQEQEMTALGDLAVIVGFIEAMSGSLPLSASKKKGRLFVSRSTALDLELEQLKPQADFGDFVIPMDNILEPGVAASALQALDDFIKAHKGGKLGSLYQDLVEVSLVELDNLYREAMEKSDTAQSASFAPLPHSVAPTAETTPSGQTIPVKEKTRGVARTYDITAPPEDEPVPAGPTPKLKVKPATAEVFTALFSQAEARGSILWSNFEAAFADLGFSATPKGGSVYTYHPPEGSGWMPITFHRPHKPALEGYPLLHMARRLKLRFGWGPNSVEVA